ncbi:hypothetical protein [Oricola cellulosilytica]|uniref:Uncharacterized protein n=1 Tax=Oricola cellulosilytica TaxID=1429082 RepID=A0A4R0PFJ9_9HYPH|nr:hypothetical protein [Oricola cellulosilytica]TCD14264.1 hypothetical protein E0D97_09290 [Oricola cellulosilytica]
METGNMIAERKAPADTESSSRGALVRRLVIFQIKLFTDGMRDLLLSPVSLAAAAFGFFLGGRNPHGAFDRLMDAGHASDRWIDLFGHHQNGGQAVCLEKMLGDIETVLREDHARGGLTAEAHRRLRSLADELRRRTSPRQSL